MNNFNLTSGWMSALRNDEHPVLVGHISLVMDKYVPEDENVKEAAERVKSHLEPLKRVKMRSLKQELTPERRRLHALTRQSLVALRGQVRSLTRSTIPEEKTAATVLHDWLLPYGKNLFGLGYVALFKRINEIVKESTTNEKISNALSSLSLTALVDNMASLNEEFKEVFDRGKDDASRVEKIDSTSIRRAADKDVRLLFDAIETGIKLNGEEKYLPTVLALKEFLDHYRILVQSRRTRKVTENSKSSERDVSHQELPFTVNSTDEENVA